MVKKESDTKNRTAYKNQHRKDHYDMILFAFSKGEKERTKIVAPEPGMPVNKYLYALICYDLAFGESKFGKKKQGYAILVCEELAAQYKNKRNRDTISQ